MYVYTHICTHVYSPCMVYMHLCVYSIYLSSPIKSLLTTRVPPARVPRFQLMAFEVVDADMPANVDVGSGS